MDKTVLILLAVVAGILLITLIKFLKHPGKFILKMLINAAIGLALLFIVNYLGASVGFSIVVNVWTVLIAGILGVPGAIFLIILALI